MKIFHGEVTNTQAVITFQGTCVDEIEQAFKDSVDDYLTWCKERGKEPEKPFSGKFVLRILPDWPLGYILYEYPGHAVFVSNQRLARRNKASTRGLAPRFNLNPSPHRNISGI